MVSALVRPLSWQ